MTARTVTSTLRAPNATARAGVPVTIELVSGVARQPGWTADAHVLGRVFTETDSTGAWTAQLEPNSGSGITSPAGTAYRVVERLADATEWPYYIQVPDTAGPHQAGDILAVPAVNPLQWDNGNLVRWKD